MFGKIMSITDELMWKYYLLLTDMAEVEVQGLRARVASGELHPKDAKIALATRIAADFHTAEAARDAAESFQARFSRGEIAEESLTEITIQIVGDSLALAKVLVEAGLATSSAEAARKIQQGGVKVDREKVADARARVDVSRPSFLLEVGRRAVKIRLQAH
jgi:tyrosyl-tRNA synthetase